MIALSAAMPASASPSLDLEPGEQRGGRGSDSAAAATSRSSSPRAASAPRVS